MTILCPLLNQYGDCLWALPTIRALAASGALIDVLVREQCQGLVPLLTLQPYIATCLIGEEVSAHSNYDQVISLAYRPMDGTALPQHIYQTAARAWRGDRALQPLDLHRPWITLGEGPSARTGTVIGFNDELWELKRTLAQQVEEALNGSELRVMRHLTGPKARWTTQLPCDWVAAAHHIQNAYMFLGGCGGLHVLAVALGTPAVIAEPDARRWDLIFWPLGMDGPQVTCVRRDEQPVWEAELVVQTLRAVFARTWIRMQGPRRFWIRKV